MGKRRVVERVRRRSVMRAMFCGCGDVVVKKSRTCGGGDQGGREAFVSGWPPKRSRGGVVMVTL